MYYSVIEVFFFGFVDGIIAGFMIVAFVLINQISKSFNSIHRTLTK